MLRGANVIGARVSGREAFTACCLCKHGRDCVKNMQAVGLASLPARNSLARARFRTQ